MRAWVDSPSRREFFRRGLLCAGVGLVTACGLPTPLQRHKERLPRLGVLRLESPFDARAQQQLAAFKDALARVGYEDGKDVVLDIRWAEGDPSRLNDHAADLTASPVDIFIASGRLSTWAVLAASPNIPVVLANHPDPVRSRLIKDAERPGGRITGLRSVGAGTAAPCLEIFHEAVPNALRLAVVWDLGNAEALAELLAVEAVAQRSGISLQTVGVPSHSGLDEWLRPTRNFADALLVIAQGFPSQARGLVVSVANELKIPAIYTESQCTYLGGLMSYGASLTDLHRRAAGYVHRILSGSHPGELPIGNPREFEIILNLSTAMELGVTLSDPALAKAHLLLPGPCCSS